MLRRCGPVVLVLLALLLLASSASATLSDLPDDTWAPNGYVLAALRTADRLYLGGDFTRVAPRVGGFARLTGSSEAVQEPFSAPMLADGDAGYVNAIIADGAGGFYLGGRFDTLGGVPRRNLAHVLADGSVDRGFAPDPDAQVTAVGHAGSTVYAAGSFTTIGGAARANVAAVDDAAGHATAWAPAVDAAPLAIATSGSTVYLGGRFTTINGIARPNAGAVDATTGATTGWDPQPDDYVSVITPAGSSLYLGGGFTHVGGVIHARLARIDATTGVAATWAPSVHGTNPTMVPPVSAIAVDGSSILIGGAFDLADGTARTGAAAIDATTGALLPWDPDVGPPAYIGLSPVTGIAVSGSTVYLAGSFSTINGGSPRTSLAAVDATSGTASSWAPWLGGYASGLVVSGAEIGVGGTFPQAGGVARTDAAALDMADGTPAAWDPHVDNTVRALLLDGSNIFLGGSFTHTASSTHHGLAKVDAAAGLSQPWGADLDNAANALALSGRTLYVGGEFSGTAAVGTHVRNYAAAVDADTGAVEAWDPDANGSVDTLAVVGDTVYLGGSFTAVHATGTPIARTGVAAVTSGGTVTGWSPGGTPNGALAVSGSSVFLAGSFPGPTGVEAVDGTTAAVGGPAIGVDANAVDALASTGTTLFLGGTFTAVDGVPRGRLAAVDRVTGALSPWDPTYLGMPQQVIPDDRGGVVAGPAFASFSALPAATGAPALGGTAVVGGSVTCANGAWSGSVPQRYAFAWLRDGAAIGGAGSASYAPSADDAGHALSCRVTATNLGGSATADSAAAAVPAPAAPAGGGGAAPGGSSLATADRTKPTLSALKLSPRAFVAEKRGASIAAAAKKRGTAVSYRVSEAASVVFTVQRKTTGRRSGRSCVTATKRLRHAKRCTLYVLVQGSFMRKRTAAGTDKLRFTGRLGGHTLPARAYRLTLVATDTAKNRSAAATITFTVKRR